MRSLHVELNSGTRMFVSCGGEGIPLLLVHGFPLDHRMWDGQLTTLADHAQVIAPDLPGFGQSSPIEGTYSMQQFADDLAEMLTALEIHEPIVFCGLSMGGYIGWQFWERHRERLAALILCDSRASADADEVRQGRHYLAERVMQDGSAIATGEMTSKLLSEATRRQRMAQVQQLREQMASTLPASVAAASRGMAERPAMIHRLAEIDLPTLVLCGQYDAITTPVEMRSMADAMPRAEYHEIPEAGHLSPWEQPLIVNSHIVRLLDGLKPRQA